MWAKPKQRLVWESTETPVCETGAHRYTVWLWTQPWNLQLPLFLITKVTSPPFTILFFSLRRHSPALKYCMVHFQELLSSLGVWSLNKDTHPYRAFGREMSERLQCIFLSRVYVQFESTTQKVWFVFYSAAQNHQFGFWICPQILGHNSSMSSSILKLKGTGVAVTSLKDSHAFFCLPDPS